MNKLIRLATPEDAASILEIYAPFVRDTVISFEVEVPTLNEMQSRVIQTLEQFPWLVCEYSDSVVGYAYGSSHSARAAYKWSANVAVYIAPPFHRRGIGRALYASLFALLRLQGFCNVNAGVTLPNASSVGLHKAIGFRPVGVYEKVGYKAGAWHDVAWFQMALQEHFPSAPPLDLKAVQAHPNWQSTLETGISMLR